MNKPKEPEFIRKERIQLSKCMVTKVVPDKTKYNRNKNKKIDNN